MNFVFYVDKILISAIITLAPKVSVNMRECWNR